jgi:DNA-binding GntR family transcriptional regulator
VVSDTRGGWPSERLLRMFVGPAWAIGLMIALLRSSNGSLNDLYAEHEELLGALNWRDADAALRGRAGHLGDAVGDLMTTMTRNPHELHGL